MNTLTSTNPCPLSSGLLRLHQILGDPARGIPALIPVSRTTWWNGIREGRYPKAVKVGARAVAWRTEDIQKLLADGVRSASDAGAAEPISSLQNEGSTR